MALSATSLRTLLITAALSCIVTLVQGLATSGTVLILARDAASSFSAYSGLQAYGIPYQVVTVPESGANLPALNASATQGNYGAIIVLSEVSYDYADGFRSALTTAQWQQLYDYQTAYGVRMARIDVYPTEEFGTTTAISGAGCCDAGVEQLISISDSSAFPTAGLKTGAGATTQGFWHYPATITNAAVAKEVAQFAPGGSFTTATTAAVINTFGSRQQMVWFTSVATEWAATSNFLQHAWIHWVTRGLFVGFRRLYLNTQIDDMFLVTELYQPAGTSFRIRPGDLATHVSWMNDINSRLPAGSQYFIEIGHNGDGDIQSAVAIDNGNGQCIPDTAIEYADQPVTPLEFQKPLGTGTNIWPDTPATYVWSLTCAKIDPLMQWWSQKANRDAFAHVSHTFAHEALNNATYSDAAKEITFNQAWTAQVGIASAARWSGNGIIPPAITGMHNGDAIRAWMDNGIKHVVGDNTRPVLRNQQNSYWPLISTVEANGYAGLVIVPRWATTIFYNCDLPRCTLQEWINTSGGSGDFQTLLNDARATNTRNLLGLHWDPFMFHQANLRQMDVPSTVVNGVSNKWSLLQIWVETVMQEMIRLVNWPVRTLKHDDIAKAFIDRMTRDQCNPNLTYNYSNDGKSITSVTVTANGNSCSAPIPVTFPGTVTSNNGGTSEKLGSDPLTVWTTLSGSPVTLTLGTPVAV